MTPSELISHALQARNQSYSPYSNFAVGAALLSKDGKLYTGCNIENAAYTPGNCAERTAFFKAVSEGVREFSSIAIVGGPKGTDTLDLCAPCGVCRQVMMEFCDPKTFQVILAKDPENYEIFTLEQILPMGFGPKDLEK
ncbi:cytidine deaminase [Acetivibrio clariflavus]|uniref:Cytidine deaminase n=1 Tax=Acetivibrio clariflavus (strain DSM 19732 / NBRC 101661 / EBR45) TaxID=720554 RepID=G8LT85_ACECE|nr:cytidine deaminase [Acetivibrio clariflavus]AEV68332.1 cytidine deaminase, homotetrameric [Acetivibrio clariflavus DSM 19732]